MKADKQSSLDIDLAAHGKISSTELQLISLNFDEIKN
jgi:hypothetical protein